ncbi:MAG TPA: DUF2167 domain-containing protein [Bacteroidia bacterium]|nr:DUF2167 domain-containing protein [Bacteroidia bacterium]
MKKSTTTFLLCCLLSTCAFAGNKHKTKHADSAALSQAHIDSLAEEMVQYGAYEDSVEKSFTYQHGTIDLPGIGTINVPPGFKYLDKKQSEHALFDLWKNPRDSNSTLGMIFPDSTGVLTSGSFIFDIEYDPMGYVKDDDADKMDYAELLQQLKKDVADENAMRVAAGYQPAYLVGWAVTPYYDKERKILHWAKEIKFGTDSINTLNYNVRILGRKGVLILNAIASMDELKTVQANLPKVMDIVSFSDGNKYKDFNPGIDKVAAWTIGGLVAGKILAKVGFLAVILKFWKVGMIALAGGFTAMRKKIAGLFKRKKDDDDSMPPGVIRPSDKWNA